jgi:hypothetical protein
MSRFIVVNEHSADQCKAMEADIPNIPPELKGKDFYCTCPGGAHGYFMFLEGDSAEDVLGMLPPSLHLGTTRALPLEVFKL